MTNKTSTNVPDLAATRRRRPYLTALLLMAAIACGLYPATSALTQAIDHNSRTVATSNAALLNELRETRIDLNEYSATVALAAARLPMHGSLVRPFGDATANMVLTQSMTGLDLSEVDTKNESDAALSTTTIEALDTDLSSTEQTDLYAQMVTIRNKDSAATICLNSTTWALTCAALTMTCRAGGGTEGYTVGPGERIAFKLLGTERPCLEGTASIAGGYDVERYTLRGNEY